MTLVILSKTQNINQISKKGFKDVYKITPTFADAEYNRSCHDKQK